MIFVYILLGMLALFAILVLVAPKGAQIERSIESSVSQELAFQHLRSLKNFDLWSPWGEMDPNMERGYKGTEGELGSVSWWKGNKKVGEGEQEVMKLVPHSYIETQLRFLKPFKAINKAYWKIEAVGTGCRVTWGFDSKFAMPMNVMFLFFNMEKGIGGDFEKGLSKWKKAVEGGN